MISVQNTPVEELKRMVGNAKAVFFGNDCATFPGRVQRYIKKYQLSESDYIVLTSSTLDSCAEKKMTSAAIDKLVKAEMNFLGIDLTGKMFVWLTDNPKAQPRKTVVEGKLINVRDDSGEIIGSVRQYPNGKCICWRKRSTLRYQFDTFEEAVAAIHRHRAGYLKFLRDHVSVIGISPAKFTDLSK